jgi:phosphatidylglycerophosphate synthase
MLKSTKTAEKASGFLGKLLGWIPIDPNSITIMSMFIALLAYMAFDKSIIGKAMTLILFLFAFFFDAIDGAIARAKNKVTKEGAFIDGIADRVVEFFLVLTLLQFFPLDKTMQAVVVSILFFGTCMTAFVKAYAEHRGIMKHEDAAKLPGLLERAERSILLLLAFILLSFGQFQYGVYLLYLIAGLSAITFLQRFFTALYSK